MKNSKDSPNKSSSNTGRKFKIPFFGVCCAPEQEPPTFENRSQLAPISSMSRELPVTGSERASIASQSTKSMLKTVKNGVQTKTTYPLNEVFILGTKYKMVTKITKIRVLKSGSKSNEEGPSNSKKNSQKAEALSKALRNSEDETNYRKDIFSLYERGITADDWDQITPEPIAKHIASRTKADIVIDALAGYGGSTIQVNYGRYIEYSLPKCPIL